MGSDTPAVAPAPFARLAGVGLIVFLANAALLVLQLVAGRLLAPFVGSSLETWTSVIGVFLTGIALGNALGGRIADRYPTPRTLAILLAIGALAALWMVAFPMLLASGDGYKSLVLSTRIPVLAAVLCLPAGFVLSLLTPLAIKLGLPDVSKTGRVAGMVFALSTLGCLLGNYLTGFYLMKTFTINELVYLSAGSLLVLSVMTMVILKETSGEPGASATGATETPVADAPVSSALPAINPYAFSDIRLAFLIVFLASFCGMALELTASRVLAAELGVSLFTWTGIIGVMLAGTALGNLTGGLIADRVNRPGSAMNPRYVLATSILVGGAGSVFLFVIQPLLERYGTFETCGPISQVLGWTFSMFFLPMFALGMISPQVIRLAVPDVAHVGRVAGKVYAWSTMGAIVGTFATGYVLLSTIGMQQTLLAIALVLTLTSLLVANVWRENTMLYLFAIVLGGVTGGFILINFSANRDQDLVVKLESNYYTIKVMHQRDYLRANGEKLQDASGNYLMGRTGFLDLYLDHLLHSRVFPEQPEELHYTHEYVQMEFLRAAQAMTTHLRVLVIGGGGYTYPRAAMELVPNTRMDVVEIDPGVTKVAKEYLGLKEYPGRLNIVHMDGRQFVAEKAEASTYDLVIQDAVNDLSVPSHLLTKEYNDAVKRVLKPDGVYLLTVIDAIEYGQLWRAAIHTLRQSYPPNNVRLLIPGGYGVSDRAVYVIYASTQSLDLNALKSKARDQIRTDVRSKLLPAMRISNFASSVGFPGNLMHGLTSEALSDATFAAWKPLCFTAEVPLDRQEIADYLNAEPRIVLTDQFAPVDNLMADVFRYRTARPAKPEPDDE
jgi:predicted membrane-bound spermidine synthase